METLPGRSQADPTASAPAPDSGRYEAASDRTRSDFHAVLAVSQALAGKLDLDHILGVAVGVVGRIAGAEGASLLMIDPETGGMSFHIAAGPGADVAKTVPLPPGAGICGHVARSGRPVIVNDAQHDPRLYRPVDQKTGLTTRNLLCVPLRCDERMWGVLELMNKQGGRDFNDRDLQLAEVVAAQIALALFNAHLHAEIVRQERMAAVGQTVSGLAHCVKNILNGLRSGSAVVDRHLKADDLAKVREGWQVVRKNNEMLSALVLDMLSLARDTTFSAFPTDVNDLADQICELMGERAAETSIRIRFEPAPGLPEMMTDPTQLYRCLLNLIANAVDACGEGGRVRVRVCRGRERPRFTISVADDGGGIPPEHRGKLFAGFFTTKGNKGTGLGLPVTRKLIVGMGGQIAFHSVVGQGTRFVIALPARQERAPEKETDS